MGGFFSRLLCQPPATPRAPVPRTPREYFDMKMDEMALHGSECLIRLPENSIRGDFVFRHHNWIWYTQTENWHKRKLPPLRYGDLSADDMEETQAFFGPDECTEEEGKIILTDLGLHKLRKTEKAHESIFMPSWELKISVYRWYLDQVVPLIRTLGPGQLVISSSTEVVYEPSGIDIDNPAYMGTFQFKPKYR